MKRPDYDALMLAADWVESYEPGAEDAQELTTVAKWLRYQAEQAQQADVVKRFMAETGCTRARALKGYRDLVARTRPAHER